MERKSLKDISWPVSEDEYRQHPALSYSTLARYEREGFNNLHKLFEKVDSASLTFGSVVDTLITGTQEDFDSIFMVAELQTPLSDILVVITKMLFAAWGDKYNSLVDIPDSDILKTIEGVTWNNHWLPKTRVNKIKEDCTGYYQLLYLADGRVIISTSTYMDALNTVDKLKSSESTKYYLEPNNMFDNSIERFYQLKFKATFNDIEYRCMMDLVLVLHDKKLIIPLDLKTSSKPEWDFYKSFLEWRYDIQAKLYWRILRYNLDKDPYFKDFKLANYRFMVINRKALTPLIWEFGSTQSIVDITLQNGTILRDPLTIGRELSYYLVNKPEVPVGIDLVKPNRLEDWFKKV